MAYASPASSRSLVRHSSMRISEACAQLTKQKLPNVLMVDCSHANSLKQHEKQEDVWRSLIEQRAAGTRAIIGAMVESYLKGGSQPVPANPAEIVYGISVTDACINWETTERMLRQGHAALKAAQPMDAVTV